MRHTPEGTLRRLVDDPLGVPDASANHVARCRRCSSRKERVEHETPPWPRPSWSGRIRFPISTVRGSACMMALSRVKQPHFRQRCRRAGAGGLLLFLCLLLRSSSRLQSS